MPSAGSAYVSALVLAIVLEPKSALHKAVLERAWPLWTRCFAECGVPCDALESPPLEILSALRFATR